MSNNLPRNFLAKITIKEILALLVIVGALGLVFCLFFIPIPKDTHGMIETVIGSILNLAGMVVGAYFLHKKDK